MKRPFHLLDEKVQEFEEKDRVYAIWARRREFALILARYKVERKKKQKKQANQGLKDIVDIMVSRGGVEFRGKTGNELWGWIRYIFAYL